VQEKTEDDTFSALRQTQWALFKPIIEQLEADYYHAKMYSLGLTFGLKDVLKQHNWTVSELKVMIRKDRMLRYVKIDLEIDKDNAIKLLGQCISDVFNEQFSIEDTTDEDLNGIMNLCDALTHEEIDEYYYDNPEAGIIVLSDYIAKKGVDIKRFGYLTSNRIQEILYKRKNNG